MHSIRVKLTAITVAAILTSLLVFSVIGYTTLSRENDRSSVENMNLISENVAQSLDAYLNSLKQSVDMAIHIAEDQLRGVSLADYGVADGHAPAESAQAQRLAAVLEEQSRAVEEALGSIANYTGGVVTYYYCLNDSISTTAHGFFYSKHGSTHFEKQPALISSELDPADTAHTTWYYSPIAQKRPIWVGPYQAHFLNEAWTVSYVAPIYMEGTPVGVIGMDILLDTMIGRVRPVRVYETGFACLLNADGSILYHPRYEIGIYPEEASDVLQSATFRRRSSGSELIRYVSGGQQRQLAFSTLTNGLKLVVTAPVREVKAAWLGLARTISLVGLGILAVFTVLALLVVAAVLRPLNGLAVASKQLAAGDYSVVLDYHGRDEVGTLTESFRQMRDYLKYYISDLNSRAYTDSMTGLRNKAAYDLSANALDRVIERGGDETPAFAIVLFDCNRLKQINDEYGHDHGDAYLRTACRAICRVYLHSPVFRIGGDEFCAILKGDDYDSRDALLRTFDMAAADINATAQHPWEKVNLSKGMAVFRPGEDAGTAAVLHRADEAMYEAKRRYKAAAGY